MFLQKYSKTTPMETEKGPCKKISFFRTSTVVYDLILVWKYVEFFMEFFYYIDFEIIAFEGRRQCFFRPCPAGSTAFDPRLCHFIEVHKAELLEIHNMWHIKYLWNKS
jgi:hypothetical protein